MKLKPSIAFEDMRGSAGGFTASKNFSRLYAKNRISPKNPQTKGQQQVRGDLSSNSRNWAALTQAQREAWIEAAKTQLGKSVMGEKAKITGFNYFIRIAQNLAVIGLPYLETPPTEMPEFPVFENNMIIPQTAGGFYAAYEANTESSASLHMPLLPDGMVWMLRISPAFKESRQKNPTAVRTYGQVPLTVTYSSEDKLYTYTFNGSMAFNNRIPAGLADGRIQSELYILDTATGITSLRQVSIGTRTELMNNWNNASIEDPTVNQSTVVDGETGKTTKTAAKTAVNDPEGGEVEAEVIRKTNGGRTVMREKKQ